MSVAVAYQSHPPPMAALRSVPEAEAAAAAALPRGPQVGFSSGAAVADADYADPYPAGALPRIVFSHEQRMLKSEDVLYVNHQPPAPGRCHSLFMVCDGHQGVGAAQHVVQTLPWILERTLPKELPDWDNSAEVAVFAEQIRRGISSAVVLADNRWTSTAQLSGTTMTLTIVSGWLVTVANTGDSSAVLDTGDHISEITLSHRIQINTQEQARLRDGGGTLAPLGFHLQGPAKPKEMGVGPLRLWPGGLCVSRSIGDLDTGPLVVPLPHVRQMVVPQDRALRLMIASDGLWDLMSYDKAAKSIRNKLPQEAAASIAAAVVRDKRMADDMSLIVLDVLPHEGLPFPVSAVRAGASNPAPKPSGGGGLFACFKPQADPVPTNPGGSLQLLADVDCLDAYPMHTHNLARHSLEQGAALRGPARRTDDYTVHGVRPHLFNTEQSWHGSMTGGSAHGGGGGSGHSNPSLHAPESARGGSMFSNAANGANGGGAANGDAGMPDALAPPAPAGSAGSATAGPGRPLSRHFTLPRDDASAVAAGAYSYTTGGPVPGGGPPGSRPPGAARQASTTGPPGARSGPSATRLVRSASATIEREGTTESYMRPQAGGGAAIGNISVISRISGSAPSDADSMLQMASELMDASEHGPRPGRGYMDHK